MANPKVLIGSPTYSGMKYCKNKFLNALRAIDYPNYDILIIDNSRDDSFFQELEQEKDITAIKDDTTAEKNFYRVVSSRNKILEYAKKHNYDYVLMIDFDVIPPEDILTELLATNKDIVSALCYNEFKSSGVIKWLPVAWKLFTETEYNEFKYKFNLPSHLTIEDVPRHLTKEEVDSEELLEVFHPTAGVMLLSKKAFSELKYDVAFDQTGKLEASDDVYFIKQARNKGYKIYCYTKILCDHLVRDKYETDKDGNLVNPLHK